MCWGNMPDFAKRIFYDHTLKSSKSPDWLPNYETPNHTPEIPS